MRSHSLRKCHRDSGDRIDVVVVDDDPEDRVLIRRAVERWKSLRCVASYSSGEEALDEIPKVSAQAVLMDVRLPVMSGITCAQQLKRLIPTLSVIMVTGMVDREALSQALNAGASGFLDKADLDCGCCEAIRFSLKGGIALAQAFKALLMQSTCKLHPESSFTDVLTQREIAIMEHFARGDSNKQIADKLQVSVYTVEYDARCIYSKLRVPNRAAAVSSWHAHSG